MENILIFFEKRSTNANAESLNSKIKLFIANLRGVTDIKLQDNPVRLQTFMLKGKIAIMKAMWALVWNEIIQCRSVDYSESVICFPH